LNLEMRSERSNGGDAGEFRTGTRVVSRFAVGMLAALSFAGSRSVRAQSSPGDRAIAEQLYEQGRTQMAAKQFEKACDSFAESLRIDAATGTLLNLASCHQARGMLASAWAEFRDAVASARRDGRLDRVRFAQERLAAIEPRLAHLIVAVAPGVDGLIVTLDGASLGAAAWGIPIPIDAGPHQLAAKTPAGRHWTASVVIVDGESRTVAVPRPGQAMISGTTATSTAHEDMGSLLAPPGRGSLSARDTERGHRRPTAGWILAGVGASALAIGAVSGLRAFSLWSDRNRECPAERCNDQGLRDGESAATAANVANWTIGAGVVALSVSALVLLWPRSARAPRSSLARALATARVDGAGRLLLGGRF
jgi:hypothetical protein